MTYSIVARDSATGAFGVATATGGPCVGSLVPHARAGVGAIATQSTTNPYYGISGLDLLEQGLSATATLDQLLAADKGRETRQCIVIDKHGNTAQWTGAEAEPHAKHFTGENYAVAGNFLASDTVIDQIAATYAGHLDTPFAARLLAAMTAGETVGGDKRGTLSTALKIYQNEAYPAIDIRVDLSNTPLAELARILDAVQNGQYAEFFRSLPSRAS